MKIKTNELTGTALDWAVAACEETTARGLVSHAKYSTDWAQGEPIIEREWISIWHVGKHLYATAWKADQGGLFYSGASSTPLIAAMRCYVFSKLGEEVDIPDELVLPGADAT